MAKLCAVLGVLIMLLSAAATPAHAIVQYTVTDLGEFSPKAINNQGEIVGGGPTGEAALWSNGIITYLGTLGGLQSNAADINDLGQVVGESHASNGNLHAFLYSEGSMNDLGNFGGKWGSADAINNNGQIAINIFTQEGGIQAYQYTSGSLTSLGNLGGNTTVAHAINSKGDIVGYSTAANGTYHAFFYSNGVMKDLGFPGDSSEAIGINDADQIIGSYIVYDSSSGEETEHAYFYDNGVINDINGDKDYSIPFDINNNGDVVGNSSIDNIAFPFIYKNGIMYGLNDIIEPTFGITLNFVACINDNGQIVAVSSNSHSYLLTPIPEPSILKLLCSLFIGIYMYMHYRKE